MINTGKALLLTKELPCNTQFSVIKNMDPHFIENREIEFEGSFADFVLQINKEKATKEFAQHYNKIARSLHEKAVNYRGI